MKYESPTLKIEDLSADVVNTNLDHCGHDC